ncbi:glycoside hydrolase family 38 domain protein [Synechococcus sp. PROS-7-1]|nr:glycoside hydrolase family 38 domain protein [Synechococcus sp. PROS-7-1]
MPPRVPSAQTVADDHRSDATWAGDPGDCDTETFQSTPIAGAAEGPAS